MPDDALDLDAYLDRIGLHRAPPATAEGLAELHEAHATHIPFENLEIHLGRGMPLELDALQDRLIRRKRGGYCFQMNRLFHEALGALGFETTLHQGRVWAGQSDVPAASHQIQIVNVDGLRWLADVGFGSGGLLRPLPLAIGDATEQGFRSFRLADAGALGFTLQVKRGEDWFDLYSFDTHPCHQVDYVFANYWLSHARESFFVLCRVCSIVGEERMVTLLNDTFRIYDANGVTEERLADGPEYTAALKRHFGIELSPEAVLPPLPGAPA